MIKKKEASNIALPELLTLQEACKILRCHPNTLRQWDKKGIFVAVRFGERRDRRYRREDIENFIKHKK
ncbi:MAG: helix-turn-helix domain-containing protein [Patescibacteria group bacterium]|nr:helix-turn-helix domain-containing protein [Patescibacteria group bacterium]MDD5715633.1 helix-turn-helix domain-containing protein [Patescibacteria group bacterium]